ncbi:hypothetical protein Unana1_03391 [Umbelopsis nana]
MRCILVITAFFALAFANTEKIIIHTTENPLINNDAVTIALLESWAQRNDWPALNAPYTSIADTIRPRSALEDGPNPINPENPHYEFQNEIPFQRWYRLHGLQDGGGYEARISYPATSPTDFRLTLLNHSQLYSILNDPTQYGSSHTTEFNDFVESESDTSIDEGLVHNTTLFLLVEGNYTGISMVKGVEFRPVKYNIALEKLHMGFIPNQAYKLAISLLVAVGFGAVFVVPAVWNHIGYVSNDHNIKLQKKRT